MLFYILRTGSKLVFLDEFPEVEQRLTSNQTRYKLSVMSKFFIPTYHTILTVKLDIYVYKFKKKIKSTLYVMSFMDIIISLYYFSKIMN